MWLVLALVALALPALLQAQQDSAGQRLGPPVRRIATASAVSTEPLGQVNAVRELPDGRVLVNDVQRRRLLLMDTSLAVVAVVLDSLTEVSNSYGMRPGALLAHRGDSALFVDPASFTMLVLDEKGRVVRVRAVPRMQDASTLTNTVFGIPGTDAGGRLVYRRNAEASRPRVRPPAGVPWFPQEADSAFLVAIDIESRRLDTLGTLRLPRSGPPTVRMLPGGGFTVSSVSNPLPLTDDWAVTSDGRVAVVRGRDYRVEYREPDGSWRSGPKLPYDWQRLLDVDKARIVDSVRSQQRRAAQRTHASEMIRWVNRYGKKQYPKGFTLPADFTIPNGHPRDWVLPPDARWPERYIFACAEGEEPRLVTTGASSTPSCIPTPIWVGGGSVPPMPTLREDAVIAAEDLPDYKPPFAPGGMVRADLDGGLWIRPIQTKPVPGGPIHDVVDARGELVDRIQLPTGYQLVGFGRGRVVFLTMRDAKGVHLARVRLR
ncbi:MAG TPA: hypothetical protein VEA99_18415 [Gemmatimonadaceae bacterium]|nr:hypothetical protein [Gemmatimonadaceae bacterium]